MKTQQILKLIKDLRATGATSVEVSPDGTVKAEFPDPPQPHPGHWVQPWYPTGPYVQPPSYYPWWQTQTISGGSFTITTTSGTSETVCMNDLEPAVSTGSYVCMNGDNISMSADNIAYTCGNLV